MMFSGFYLLVVFSIVFLIVFKIKLQITIKTIFLKLQTLITHKEINESKFKKENKKYNWTEEKK